MKVHDLLFALARDAKANVDIHPGISGYITLNAIDQTLPQLLARIAKQVDMRFELDGKNIVVMPDTPYLKHYQVDYVNMARNVTGTVSTNTQISTSALTPGNGATSPNTSRIQIENSSKNRLWESLEANIKGIVQETGRQPTEPETSKTSAAVIANPESGVISVRANSKQHEKVQEFVNRVLKNAQRQVLIEATVVEVTLADGYQQGIDWERIGGSSEFNLARPTSSTNLTNTVTPYIISYAKTGSTNLASTIELLRSFGDIRVLSSPKLSVLNNQTATLKVTEDYVYFNVKSDTTTTANVGTTVGVTTTPQSVSVGFFMSITAQISDNDNVTLNVRPSISSIAELKKDPNPIIPASIPNYIPQIRTREIESLMRINSGDIAVLGGLMEDRQDNKTHRIPVLGDVPVVGELFNTRSNSSSKSELVILLRPTVIKNSSIGGDYSRLRESLPDKAFFSPAGEFRPFTLPGQESVPQS
ncbi:pilus (MSHA type) biogenesis protein MshL [Propionivibrio limicola]|uniref:pilus (MSHA type) biogenesis protein MshL n=1 Tax=Propionivibrio limicola TaxID=167645 RepID=UPI001FE2528C|nr:pilus (MSHA type) biogenesis protein MshL [Propionivibrio limicola]